MRVTDGHGQSVCRIAAGGFCTRQQPRDHGMNLHLVGMAHANHGFFDVVWRIFKHHDTEQSGHQQRHTARLAELQGGIGVFVDEGFFHRAGLRRPCPHHFSDAVVQLDFTTPCAKCLRRDPSFSITPQPVVRRPGSMPRMINPAFP
jgi:hypothetical protein